MDDESNQLLDGLHEDLLRIQARLLNLKEHGVVFVDDSLDERILKALVQFDLLDRLRLEHSIPRQF